MTGYLFGGGAGTTVTATGSTVPISLSDRFAQVTNVLNFGTDRAAIQAAINYAGGGGDNKGTIEFPPANYTLDGPVYIGNGGATGSDNVSFRLVGHGMGSYLNGTFSDFLIKKPNTTGSGGSDTIQTIEGLNLNNASTNAASGCLSFYGSMVKVKHCRLIGMMGVDVSQNCLSHIYHNVIRSSGTRVGLGIALGGECSAVDNDIVGMAGGITAWGICGAIIDNRIELCGGTAINLGSLADFTFSSASGYLVAGNSLEGNGCGIYARSVGYSNINTTNIHGESGGNDSYAGLVENGCSYTTFSNIQLHGDFATTALSYSGKALSVGVAGDAEGPGVVFENIDCSATTGTAWSILNATNAQFRGCKGLSYETTFANKPSSPLDGDLRTFSNVNAADAVFGGTVGASGTGTAHMEARYSGRTSSWTVVAAA